MEKENKFILIVANLTGVKGEGGCMIKTRITFSENLLPLQAVSYHKNVFFVTMVWMMFESRNIGPKQAFPNLISRTS